MKNKKGFTFVEIMIVIAVMGLLAAIFVGNIQEAGKKAKAKAEEEALKNRPAQQETLSVALEWKEGVKATPENIEIVYEVKETRIDKKEDAQFLVLVGKNGEERYILLNENLLSWKINK